eukprot:TRINITY_DN24866_c0_g2_i1.p1 TRINITY_DN24866_c0_g2~~TRINITY_DN24866_c0_g2_i1.p1  ORF type:complete len:777 (-),score=241.12 TRINITY_DN24866_c0_g2_i1:153-2483(-)
MAAGQKFSVVQVELLACRNGSSSSSSAPALTPLTTFFLDMQEMTAHQEQAVDEIRGQANSFNRLTKLVYQDDEKEWCTLTKDTLHDALEFLMPVHEGECEIGQLQVWAQFEKDAPAFRLEEHTGVDYPGNDVSDVACDTLQQARDIASTELSVDNSRFAAWCSKRRRLWVKNDAHMNHPSVNPGRENEDITLFYAKQEKATEKTVVDSTPPNPQQNFLLEAAMKEINKAGVEFDLRELLPKLAEAALKVIENEQEAAPLFQLLDVLVSLRDGCFGVENLPSVLPDFLAVLLSLPPSAMWALLTKFKTEADKVLATMREERAKHQQEQQEQQGEQEKKDPAPLEVHPNVQCDGCDMFPIVGNRYKSLVQCNFDLCQACFQKTDQSPAEWAHIRSNVLGEPVASYYAPRCNGPVHHGIICDGCDVHPVVGQRFKCLDIDDFDLCKACYDKRHESERLKDMRFEEMAIIACTPEAVTAMNTCTGASFANETPVKEEAAADKTTEAKDVEMAEAVKVEEPASTTTVNEEEENMQAVEAVESLESLSEQQAKAALRDLLAHESASVRLAVQKALRAVTQQAQEKVPAAAKEEPEEEKEVEKEPQPATPEEETTNAAAEEAAEPMQEEPVPEPSAFVQTTAELVLGIEAQEEEAARGDCTAEVSGAIAAIGATQAFRMGRMLLPTGDGPAAPACAKIIVVNDGKVAWPEQAVLTIVGGDAFGFPHLALGALNPAEAAMLTLELLVPRSQTQNMSRSTWAIMDGSSGRCLGPVLFFEVAHLPQ